MNQLVEEKECPLCGRGYYRAGNFCSSRCQELAAEDDRAASWPPQEQDA